MPPARLDILQTLPINETSDDNSPYNAISSLAIEPATIAISPRPRPRLDAKEIQRTRPAGLAGGTAPGPVNYPKVKALKRALLEAAFESFFEAPPQSRHGARAAVPSFCRENDDWLSDYALFRMLMEENGDARLGPLATQT